MSLAGSVQALAAQVTKNTGGAQSDRLFTTSVTLMDSALGSSFRLIDSEVGLGYQGSTSVSGSLVAIRGNTTITAGTTVTGQSYLYGVQGKLTIQGYHTGTAEVSCGVLGQLDLSAAQAVTAPVACVWADCGASVGTATGANIDGVVIYNTISTLKINSAIRISAYTNYLFDLSDPGTNWFLGTNAATAAGTLKINMNGTAKYIQLYSSES
jgi:hypothetical protein